MEDRVIGYFRCLLDDLYYGALRKKPFIRYRSYKGLSDYKLEYLLFYLGGKVSKTRTTKGIKYREWALSGAELDSKIEVILRHKQNPYSIKDSFYKWYTSFYIGELYCNSHAIDDLKNLKIRKG